MSVDHARVDHAGRAPSSDATGLNGAILRAERSGWFLLLARGYVPQGARWSQSTTISTLSRIDLAAAWERPLHVLALGSDLFPGDRAVSCLNGKSVDGKYCALLVSCRAEGAPMPESVFWPG